jgi:hypothetical protein
VGVAVCHFVALEPVALEPGLLRKPGLLVDFDLILPVEGGVNQPIALAKIEKFFCWLKDQCGFRFGLVTADSFQATYLL